MFEEIYFSQFKKKRDESSHIKKALRVANKENLYLHILQ